ncbi:hypothetical protein [Desulfobacter sp. UBA2225]|uniref:hypothetical protein n=1 Tax=Desulfobacter sp. UBA2225 TaxID=1961413 RepID=UPI00257C3AB4|nr:hypothetical protein [Desulfobacter sp. UBA2225]
MSCKTFVPFIEVPHDLNSLILLNKKVLFTCLFTAVRDTLFAFAADPQWHLGGKPGLLTVLHT